MELLSEPGYHVHRWHPAPGAEKFPSMKKRSIFDIMSRARDYYREQRKRIIKKKRRHLADCWFASGKPSGAFAKNKFHCPIHTRQRKTTPKASAYRYGDRKHNWSRRDARAIDRMRSQVLEWQRTNWAYNPLDDELLHENSEEQSASSEAFFEMAGRLPRDSSGRCSLVVAVGAKEKNIAHFHVFRTEEDKEAWIGGACLFFTENRYYDHAKNQETLTKDEMRDLIRLLTSPYKRDKRITNWQQLVYLWNDNNERYEIPDDTPMPIYDCNTITRYTE